MTYSYGNEASVIVCVSGIKQRTDTYALINGQIVFTVAPASGTGNIELTYLGGRVVTNPYLSADTQGIVRINANIISENVSVATGYNASTAGPVSIANNFVVILANNSTWTIF